SSVFSFSSRRRHTRSKRDWSSDVCSSDLVPVVEETGELIGIVTVDDVIDVLNDEAMQDFSGLAGVDVDEQYSSPWNSAKSRLPWLITLLFLGMGTSTLISQYEGMISEVATLSL